MSRIFRLFAVFVIVVLIFSLSNSALQAYFQFSGSLLCEKPMKSLSLRSSGGGGGGGGLAPELC